MKAIELFAGIGGFRLAADRLQLDTVWANDHCPRACKIYRHNFGPGAIQEGDIAKLLDRIPRHDLLTAGFPCQPFSSAGKKRGITDPRGTLFSVVVDVVRRRQPPFFVLENVKRLLTMERGIHFATILASLAESNYRIEWRLLNAADFGLPQNRQRVFIIGSRLSGRKAGARGAIRLATRQDLQSGSIPAGLLDTPESWPEIGSHGRKFPTWGLAVGGRFCGADLESFSQRAAPAKLEAVLQTDVPSAFDFTASTIERLKASTPVKRFVQGVEILSNQGGGARMGYTVFGINGLAPTLTSTASRHYERYKIGARYRRLTNVEYARLQGFPDDHCAAVSIYDQYALYGNAVPVPMAAWVMERTISPSHGAPSADRTGRRSPRR